MNVLIFYSIIRHCIRKTILSGNDLLVNITNDIFVDLAIKIIYYTSSFLLRI